MPRRLPATAPATAIENLPLTFIFTRPDGVEDRRIVSDGGSSAAIRSICRCRPTPCAAPGRCRSSPIPKGTAIGEKQFLVDDFVPDRIEFDLTSEAKEIDARRSRAAVDVDGRYLYGAPAAGLDLEGDVALKTTRESAGFPGYLFGLADEEASEDTQCRSTGWSRSTTTARRPSMSRLPTLPSTTQLLNANITVRMQEAGGRAVERSLTLPVKAGRRR